MNSMELNPAEKTQLEQAIRQYLEKHDLPLLFSQMMKHLCVDRPKEPIPYLQKFLIEHRNCYRKSFRRIFMLGHPLSNYKQMATEFVEKGFTDMVVITLDDLLRQKGVTSDIEYSASQIILSGRELCKLLKMFMKESGKKEEIKKNGIILCGFPQTRDQNLALQEIGIYPDHFFIMEYKNKAEYNRKFQAVDYDKDLELMRMHYEKNREKLFNCFEKEVISIIDAGLPLEEIFKIWKARLQGMQVSK